MENVASKMQTIQSSFASLLELIERKIGQMDAFDPRDAEDLDTLLHCRERVKVAARIADTNDGAATSKYCKPALTPLVIAA